MFAQFLMRAVFVMALVLPFSSAFATPEKEFPPQCLEKLAEGTQMAGCPVQLVLDIQKEHWPANTWRFATVSHVEEHWLAGIYPHRNEAFILPMVAPTAQEGDVIFYTTDTEKGARYTAFLLAVDADDKVTKVTSILRINSQKKPCLALVGQAFIYHGVGTIELKDGSLRLIINKDSSRKLTKTEFKGFDGLATFAKRGDRVAFGLSPSRMHYIFTSLDEACGGESQKRPSQVILNLAKPRKR